MAYWHWSQELAFAESQGENGEPSVVQCVEPCLGQFSSPPQAFCPLHVTSHIHELVHVMMPLHAPEVWQSI